MGKTSKGRTHQGKSTYPYRTPRVGQHVHVIRPKLRRQGAQPYFIGASSILGTSSPDHTQTHQTRCILSSAQQLLVPLSSGSQAAVCAGLFAARQQSPYITGPKLRKQPQLKRLSFVRAYSVFLSAKLASIYSR